MFPFIPQSTTYPLFPSILQSTAYPVFPEPQWLVAMFSRIPFTLVLFLDIQPLPVSAWSSHPGLHLHVTEILADVSQISTVALPTHYTLPVSPPFTLVIMTLGPRWGAEQMRCSLSCNNVQPCKGRLSHHMASLLWMGTHSSTLCQPCHPQHPDHVSLLNGVLRLSHCPQMWPGLCR